MTINDGRQCTKCKMQKEWSRFYKKSNGKDGYSSECKDCRLIYQRSVKHKRNAWNREYRKSNSEREYKYAIKYRYGLSAEQYDFILKSQMEKCAACGEKETQLAGNAIKRLSVDHDHQTGKVRGLLCNSCNRTIGYSKDNDRRLSMCADYLRRASSDY